MLTHITFIETNRVADVGRLFTSSRSLSLDRGSLVLWLSRYDNLCTIASSDCRILSVGVRSRRNFTAYGGSRRILESIYTFEWTPWSNFE